MDVVDEATFAQVRPALAGAGRGLALTLACAVVGAFAANLALPWFTRLESTNGHCCQITLTVDERYHVVAPLIVALTAAGLGALAGRRVHGGWRGALAAWGTLAFSGAAAGGVALWPLSPAGVTSPFAAALAAGAAGGAALLRVPSAAPTNTR